MFLFLLFDSFKPSSLSCTNDLRAQKTSRGKIGLKIRDGLMKCQISEHPTDQNQASYLFVRTKVWPELSLSIQSEVCVVIVLQSLSHCSKQAVFISAHPPGMLFYSHFHLCQDQWPGKMTTVKSLIKQVHLTKKRCVL